jgi:hypothetical protein
MPTPELQGETLRRVWAEAVAATSKARRGRTFRKGRGIEVRLQIEMQMWDGR